MKTVKVEALDTISGTYGFVRAGEVVELSEDKAKELIERKLVKEAGDTKGKIVVPNLEFDSKAAVMKGAKVNQSNEAPAQETVTDPANATVETPAGETQKELKKSGRKTKEMKNAPQTKEEK